MPYKHELINIIFEPFSIYGSISISFTFHVLYFDALACLLALHNFSRKNTNLPYYNLFLLLFPSSFPI